MLVRFDSSETGELLMFAEVAKSLLTAVGKDTTARGCFMPDEMAAAAARLRAAVEASAVPPVPDDDGEGTERELPVGFAQRAWPLIDMLERTARGGVGANIVWQAAKDF